MSGAADPEKAQKKQRGNLFHDENPVARMEFSPLKSFLSRAGMVNR